MQAFIRIQTLLWAFLLALSAYGQEALPADTLASQADSVPDYRITPLPQEQPKGFWGWLKNNLAGTTTVPSDKPFDYTVVAGPFYSNTASFSIAAGVTGQYSWDRSDTALQKSTVSAVAQVSVKGMVSAEVVGENFMKHDRLRWNYRLKWQRMPIDFWGSGYENGRYAEKERFNRNRIFFKPEVLVRLWGPLYAGIGMNIDLTNASDLKDKSKINGQSDRVFAVGAGPIIQFDTRDNTSNATRGVLLRVNQLFYPNFANKIAFSSTDVTFSAYQRVWKGGVLCGELHGWFNGGDEIPWTMMAQVADNSCRMRGYYEGRYRDRNILEAQIELRQKVYKRIGVAVFGGAANVFGYFNDINWRHTLPNYGLGLRYEFKRNTNLRLDLGFTKDKPGVVFNISEAF